MLENEVTDMCIFVSPYDLEKKNIYTEYFFSILILISSVVKDMLSIFEELRLKLFYIPLK